jgi:uncharacterized protein (TIGR02996 family)
VTDSACGTGLLADVIDHPADDTPRLIYADWLEDNPGGCRFPAHAAGRAELIRVQVALEREALSCDMFMFSCGEYMTLVQLEAGGCQRCKRFACLTRREGELLDAVGYYAVHHLADEPTAILIGGKERVGIHRGFVGAWNMTLSQWLEHGPGLVRRHPLTRVELTDKRPVPLGGPGPQSRLRVWDSGYWRYPHYLPPEVVAFLRGRRLDDTEPAVRGYETDAEAVDAASAALIAWAKDQKTWRQVRGGVMTTTHVIPNEPWAGGPMEQKP